MRVRSAVPISDKQDPPHLVMAPGRDRTGLLWLWLCCSFLALTLTLTSGEIWPPLEPGEEEPEEDRVVQVKSQLISPC